MRMPRNKVALKLVLYILKYINIIKMEGYIVEKHCGEVLNKSIKLSEYHENESNCQICRADDGFIALST
jgi:hypothetical protein